MAALANDLRRGMAIKYNGNTAIVLEVHHRTPGNKRAFVQAIIRYINTGNSADVRLGSTDKVDIVEIERKQLEFSYKDHNGYHFMDPETYDTIALHENLVGDAKDYLVENLGVQVLYADGKAVQLEMPASVSLTSLCSATSITRKKPCSMARGEPSRAGTDSGRSLLRAGSSSGVSGARATPMLALPSLAR